MFDFDGTLSPLVTERTAASLDSACRDMLHRLAAVQGFHCAIISSRQLADLESRVDVPGIFLGGGSGLEWKLPDGRRQVPDVARMDAVRKIRKTVIHELAHHFGYTDRDLEPFDDNPDPFGDGWIDELAKELEGPEG